MAALLDTPLRYFHTLRHLGLKQALYYAKYRLLPEWQSPVTDPAEPLRHRTSLTAGPCPPGFAVGEESFRFLNQEVALKPEVDGWCPAGESALWTYNLHYFDYLQDEGLSPTRKQQLLSDWVAKNAPGSQPGWDP